MDQFENAEASKPSPTKGESTEKQVVSQGVVPNL